ncbi:hypothetical protein [Paenibacillus lemnae]|uniref:Uncharacterized protein n=1 Tax=Paenibacillus lemnae TaxID=1330551 RepID=A0A848M828_PAELE|nr:hypothetical protein [Paenibacillus lemnae]NMO96361.1 hypothetical protein [Paenibacillus lemnae]
MPESNKDLPIDHGPGNTDHAEQYPTKEESLFDKFKSQETVDPIPMEDLNQEKQEEKRRDGTSKDSSSSDDKYHSGF